MTEDEVNFLEPPDAPTSPEAAEKWVIRDDQAADWALARIALKEKRKAEAQALRDERIARANAHYAAVKTDADSGIAYMESKLRDYYEQTLRPNGYVTAKKRRYPLELGALRFTGKQRSLVVQDEEVAVKHLLADEALAVFVRFPDPKAAIQKDDLKKVLAKRDDGKAVIAETGEEIPGLSFPPVEEEFKVEVKG